MNSKKLATVVAVAALALAAASCGGETEAEDTPKVPAVTTCITPVPPHATTSAPSIAVTDEPNPRR